MRQNLDFLDAERSLRSVAVTSALAQEGKSTVAALLAHANAAAGKRTLLLECDLRRPTLAARLGLKEAPGLCDYLGGSAAPQEILQTVATNPLAELDEHNGGPTAAPRHPAARLVCITAGSSPRPAELLASDRFRAFMAEVREAYDFVVLDTSPLVPVVDTRELLPLVDGVIVCVRAAQTTREAAAAAKEALGRTPSRPTGIVVTGITPRTDLYYHYYSSYSERT
jgi:capsular exopolysaccharide synthesis family protein